MNQLPKILETGTWVDPKSKFQEMAQERDGYTPAYRVIEESGPDHGLAGREHPGRDDRGDRIGRVVHSVQKIEKKSEHDDGDDADVHVAHVRLA